MYARKLDYAAHDGEEGASFLALIEIAGRKGGTPKMYVLYRYEVDYRSGKFRALMFHCNLMTAEDNIHDYFLYGKKFPGWKEEKWKKTSLWLYAVGVGGWYTRYSKQEWVKVGTPPRKWRSSRRLLRVADPNSLLMVYRDELRHVEEDETAVTIAVYDIDLELGGYIDDGGFWAGPDKYQTEILVSQRNSLKVEAEELIEEKYRIRMMIMNLVDELRFKFAQIRAVPFYPRNKILT